MSWKNWHLEMDDNGLAHLTLDKHDTDTNVLSVEVLSELNSIIEQLEQDSPAGLILKSGKKNGFCAGADVEEFTKIKTRDQAYEHIRRAQNVLDRLENLPCPSLALIHGFCLGGGLELALACHYRISNDDRGTRIGLPEVKLGIHPGFAGSVRLTHLIGAPAAMSMILPGRTVDGRTAERMGIVSHAVPDRLLHVAGLKFFRSLPPRPKAGGWRALTNSAIARPLLAYIFRKQLAKKARPDHYPAPYAQVDIWQKHAGDKEKMKLAEAESVARLVVSRTAQNLIRLFFLQTRLKQTGKSTGFRVQRVHVIGAGVMGGDIAAWCAFRGMTVTLQDRNNESIAPAIRRAHKLFERKFKSRREIQHANDRLIPDVDGHGVRTADVIIEAIFEDLEIKQKLFMDIEKRARPDAVLATNTSSLLIEDIARDMKDTSRLVGIHFFNPVSQMMLVEIVQGASSSKDSLHHAAAFTSQIGKLPLIVKSSPGFLVNRVLMPYMLEAMYALEEGIPGPVIDQAARNFGMPMGPIELADTVGLDICLHVARILGDFLHIPIPKRLEERVNAGHLGKKSGEGFYRYHNNRHWVQGVSEDRIPVYLPDRLMLSMLNEVKACVAEGIAGDEDATDAGIVFGTGFSPFLGGPLKYIRDEGKKDVKSRLKALEKRYGDRFAAKPGW